MFNFATPNSKKGLRCRLYKNFQEVVLPLLDTVSSLSLSLSLSLQYHFIARLKLAAIYLFSLNPFKDYPLFYFSFLEY